MEATVVTIFFYSMHMMLFLVESKKLFKWQVALRYIEEKAGESKCE